MDWMIVALAGFLGGMLNAVAGGGSFITLPALIFVGVPPIAANATGTAALLPGYIASTWRFRGDMEQPPGLGYLAVSMIAVLGGFIGAVILLLTDDQVFSALIPWLILFATAAFILGPRILKRKPVQVRLETARSPVLLTMVSGFVLFAVCLYGGYFNGGLGIILLAVFGLLGQSNLHGMNGLKNAISALLTVVAVIVYMAGDTIDYDHLFLLASAAIVGGYVGAAWAYRIPQSVLRGFIVVVGCVMSVVFFLR